MSKQIRIDIKCPNCSSQYSDNFFRTIWGENKAFRNMVMSDNVNIARCPHCGHHFHLPLAMMYVDVETGFAVWWEPRHDSWIDSDSATYAEMFGADSYYAKAPRIKDWEEFKQIINEYYSGERIGGPITKFSFSVPKENQSSQISVPKENPSSQKGNGCLGGFLLLIMASSVFFLSSILVHIV